MKKYNKLVLCKSDETLFNLFSLVLMLFILYYMSFGINIEIKQAIYFFYVIISVLLQILTFFRLENNYIFVKAMQIGKKHLFFVPVIVLILGLCELIIQYISMNTLHQPVNIFNSIITVPVIILSLNCYLRNLNKKYELINLVGPRINLAAIRLFGTIVLLFLCALWGSYERNNFSIPSLFINLVYEWLAMIVMLIQCIYAVMALLHVAGNRNTIKGVCYKSLFPHGFFISGGIMIVAWGSVSMYSEAFILETSYLLTTLIYIGLYVCCIYMIRKMIGCTLKGNDVVMAIVCNTIILLNYFWVQFNAANNITGDFLTIIVEVISLIGYIGAGVYIVKNDNVEKV